MGAFGLTVQQTALIGCVELRYWRAGAMYVRPPIVDGCGTPALTNLAYSLPLVLPVERYPFLTARFFPQPLDATYKPTIVAAAPSTAIKNRIMALLPIPSARVSLKLAISARIPLSSDSISSRDANFVS